MLSFTVVDLFAATVNAFNGGLLAQRPDHYKRKYFTAVGILVMAIFGGIGGGITRDVLLNEIPGAITDARYLWLCLGAGVLALFLAYGTNGRSSGRPRTSSSRRSRFRGTPWSVCRMGLRRNSP